MGFKFLLHRITLKRCGSTSGQIIAAAIKTPETMSATKVKLL